MESIKETTEAVVEGVPKVVGLATDVFSSVRAAVVGTPDDLIAMIHDLQRVTGGFGVVLGFAHDWANREATLRSWDLVARYVIPAVNGTIRPQIESAEYVAAHRNELMAGATAAVMSKILGHQGAAAAMATTMQQMAARAAEQQNDPTFRPGGGLPKGQ